MSLLSRILGRRPAPPPPPPPPPAPVVAAQPPPPPPSNTLVLTGEGLDGATGPVEIVVKVGDRTFAAAATRRVPGSEFPAEYRVHDIREIEPEPEPEVAADEPAPAAADEPAPAAVDEPAPAAVDEPAPAAVDEPAPAAADEPAPAAADEPAPAAADEPSFIAAVQAPSAGDDVVAPPADEVVQTPAHEVVQTPADEVVVPPPDAVAAAREPAPAAVAVAEPADAREIAVVRRPITDAEGSVVGYELVTNGTLDTPAATAGLLLDAFGDIGLERLAGRHPVWVSMTTEFLLEVGTPPVRPDRVVLQLAAAPATDDVLAALRRLQWSGYTLALEGYDEQLAEVANLVRIPVAGRSDDELAAAIAAPAGRNLELVATDVDSSEELARCRALGFTYFQGDFFAKPNLTRQRRVGTGGIAALKALAEVARPDATFEDLEQAISSDVGLSLKLLRYVNSAFFALPRTVESVREALTLLGTATVRRWATVMALVEASDAPEELVELALQRARMCEVLGGNRELDASDGAFTVGLFSVADALLDAPMEDVLETLPFSDEIRAALLRREGPKGELLASVVAYEQGEFPTDDGGVSLSSAYGESLDYAGGAVRAAR